MKSAVSNVFFSPCHIFANTEKEICPWSIQADQRDRKQLWDDLGAPFLVGNSSEMQLFCATKHLPVTDGHVSFRTASTTLFSLTFLRAATLLPGDHPAHDFQKKLLVQPALTFPINLYRLGLSEIQQMLDTRPAPALAGDTAVAPFGSLSGLESSPPNTCNSVLSLSFKNGPHYCWYRKLSGTALGLDPKYTTVRYRIPVHSVSGYSEFSFWLYIRCDMIILI